MNGTKLYEQQAPASGGDLNNRPVLYYPDFAPPIDWLRSFLLFYPKVARIVPEEGIDDDIDLRLFRESFPDAVEDIPATKHMIELDDLQLSRLDRALAEISTPVDSFTVSFGSNNETEFPGYVFLHRSKVSSAVEELLLKHDLMPEFYQTMAYAVGASDKFLVVKDEAANLILSLLADRVARDRGLDSVTSDPLNYSLLAVNGLGIGSLSGGVPGTRVEKVLASAVIQAQIPQGLPQMSIERYRNLREEFLRLREPLEHFMSSKVQLQQLDRISNAATLADEIHDSAERCSQAIDEVRARVQKGTIKHWIPFSLLSVIGVVSAVAVDPLVGLSLSSVSILVGAIDKVLSDPEQIEKEAARLNYHFASLRGESNLDRIGKLIHRLM